MQESVTKIRSKISEIQVVPIKPQNGLIAFASFVYDNNLYLGSIAVITRLNGGYRLVYPSKKASDKNLNIFHPINQAFGQEVEKLIVEKLEEVMKKYGRHNSISSK